MAYRIERISNDSAELLKSVTKSNEEFKKSLERMNSVKVSSSIESVKQIIKEQSFIHPVHDSKESLLKEFVTLGGLGKAADDIASMRTSKDKISVKRSQIEVVSLENDDQELASQDRTEGSKHQSQKSAGH